MYSTTEDYGQIRLANVIPTRQSRHLFTLSSIGWQKCNDRYQFGYEQGCPTHLLLLTVHGSGYLHMKGRQFTLPAGSIAFVPRSTPCRYGTPANGLWEFYWLHPAGAAATGFLAAVAQNDNFLTDFEPGYNYGQRLEELLRLCSGREHGTDLHISQQLSELLHHVALRLSEPRLSLSLSDRAIRYMERRFHAHITVEETAQALFVSPPHLIRVFKKETGYTPHEYLMEYRLLIAAQLLEFGQHRVEEIAAQTGFSSPSHFVSSFRKQYGCTPLQYRRMASIDEKDRDKLY